MPISISETKKIAQLARLKFDEDQLEEFTSGLCQILELIEQMNQIDTESTVPLAHPLDMVQRLREDKVTEENQQEKFLTLAPASEGGLYLVPKVIE